MKRKNTSQLQKELRTTADLNRFLKTNLDQFVCTDFQKCFNTCSSKAA